MVILSRVHPFCRVRDTLPRASRLRSPSLRCNDQARSPVCIRTSDPQFSLTDQGWVVVALYVIDRGVGVGPGGPLPNLLVPYSPSARGLSCFERGAVTKGSRTSWPFLLPQSVSPYVTPSKHEDLRLPTYASGGPEHDPGGCTCSPPFPSGPVSPTKSLNGLGASSHQSPPPTLCSVCPYHIYGKSRIYDVSPCQRTSCADT